MSRSAIDNIGWFDKSASRHFLRGDETTRMWPERATGRDSLVNAAEIEHALSRVPETPIVRASLPLAPAIGLPPMSLSAASKLLGISPAGLLKRVRRFGWNVATAQVGRHDRAAGIDFIAKTKSAPLSAVPKQDMELTPQ